MQKEQKRQMVLCYSIEAQNSLKIRAENIGKGDNKNMMGLEAHILENMQQKLLTYFCKSTQV